MPHFRSKQSLYEQTSNNDASVMTPFPPPPTSTSTIRTTPLHTSGSPDLLHSSGIPSLRTSLTPFPFPVTLLSLLHLSSASPRFLFFLMRLQRHLGPLLTIGVLRPWSMALQASYSLLVRSRHGLRGRIRTGLLLAALIANGFRPRQGTVKIPNNSLGIGP